MGCPAVCAQTGMQSRSKSSHCWAISSCNQAGVLIRPACLSQQKPESAGKCITCEAFPRTIQCTLLGSKACSHTGDRTVPCGSYGSGNREHRQSGGWAAWAGAAAAAVSRWGTPCTCPASPWCPQSAGAGSCTVPTRPEQARRHIPASVAHTPGRSLHGMPMDGQQDRRTYKFPGQLYCPAFACPCLVTHICTGVSSGTGLWDLSRGDGVRGVGAVVVGGRVEERRVLEQRPRRRGRPALNLVSRVVQGVGAVPVQLGGVACRSAICETVAMVWVASWPMMELQSSRPGRAWAGHGQHAGAGEQRTLVRGRLMVHARLHRVRGEAVVVCRLRLEGDEAPRCRRRRRGPRGQGPPSEHIPVVGRAIEVRALPV